MTNGGDAAEQMVRLSLEGFEVAAKLTGSAAKNVAIMLAAALKQEHRTRGKARLTGMIKSGKELKVFAIPQRDLKKFTREAKRYGVLYCALRGRGAKDGSVDMIARAEDASKIQRIVDRYGIGSVDRATVSREKESRTVGQSSPATPGESIVDEAMGTSSKEEKPKTKEKTRSQRNPTNARADKNPPSERSSTAGVSRTDKGKKNAQTKKPSVRDKLTRIKSALSSAKAAERETVRPKTRSNSKER